MSRTTADIVNEIVRFTVQRAPGVSVAGDPTAMMQAWMEVANAWLGEETYRSNLDAWKAQHGRRVPSDARPYRMSFLAAGHDGDHARRAGHPRGRELPHHRGPRVR